MSAEEQAHPSAQGSDNGSVKPKEELEWVTIPERCDQCGSQSYYKIVLKTGELFLCYHHYNHHEKNLFDIAEDIIDESELLHNR